MVLSRLVLSFYTAPDICIFNGVLLMYTRTNEAFPCHLLKKIEEMEGKKKKQKEKKRLESSLDFNSF